MFQNKPAVQNLFAIYDIYFLSVGGAYSPEHCQGYEVVDSTHFFPVPWIKGNELTVNRKLDEWAQFFKDAYSVDFYSSSVKNTWKILRPEYYGGKKPAYAYLGPKFCPWSFSSERTF